MVNVWFVLNDQAPQNQLVFLEMESGKTVMSHMLHAKYEDTCHKKVLYEGQMRWGSFYCFLSGQQKTARQVLLHGALDVPGALPLARRSMELRYTIEEAE